jgi:hypothetical protein
MSRSSAAPEAAVAARPDGPALVAYIEDMLLQLAEMASVAGETALAASLAVVAIQAGAARDRPVCEIAAR